MLENRDEGGQKYFSHKILYIHMYVCTHSYIMKKIFFTRLAGALAPSSDDFVGGCIRRKKKLKKWKCENVEKFKPTCK